MISLQAMTLELCKEFYQMFENDPAVFRTVKEYKPYVYCEAQAEVYYDRQVSLGRIYLAVMHQGAPIGEVILKNLDQERKCCTLSIHLQNDAVKGKGFGTAAERLALEYAFSELGMETVFADALLTNTRSRHVLEKAGFVQTHQDAEFAYYRCDRA